MEKPDDSDIGLHDDADPGFYNRRQVCVLTTLSTVTIWRMERRGEFPKSKQLSRNRVGWPRAAVNEWLRKRSVAPAPENS